MSEKKAAKVLIRIGHGAYSPSSFNHMYLAYSKAERLLANGHLA